MYSELAAALKKLDPADANYATRFVELILAAGRRCGASDVHLQPTPDGLELRFRVDGVLAPLGTFPSGTAANVVARLKVLAELLTYRTDLPQEGRIRGQDLEYEVRVSTFPTLHGERAVVRLLAGKARFRHLSDLGLPEEIFTRLTRLLGETSGALLITGPAGSGKTTTLYACLNDLVDHGVAPRSIVTLEDPIEMAIPGAAQSQVNDAAGFNLATALRSVLRQDPEVIMVGEIRDRATAEGALQASLTGQLVLSSFHAGSAAAAIRRLLDMGLEPYALRSGLLAIVFQRLVRTLCSCAQATQDEAEFLGLNVRSARVAIGCDQCGGTGYLGRTVLAEMLSLDDERLAQAVLAKAELSALERLALEAGMTDRWTRAQAAVELGVTSPAEVRRVLGFSSGPAE